MDMRRKYPSSDALRNVQILSSEVRYGTNSSGFAQGERYPIGHCLAFFCTTSTACEKLSSHLFLPLAVLYCSGFSR